MYLGFSYIRERRKKALYYAILKKRRERAALFLKRLASPMDAGIDESERLCGGQSGEIFAAEDVNKLSGGQQRLAAHARAMLYERELLILDEPSASLNEKTAAEVMDFVFGLPSALLFITHDMALAKRADRILRMEKGKFKNIG